MFLIFRVYFPVMYEFWAGGKLLCRRSSITPIFIFCRLKTRVVPLDAEGFRVLPETEVLRLEENAVAAPLFSFTFAFQAQQNWQRVLESGNPADGYY